MLDAADLCEYLRISRPTLERLIDLGRAPPCRDLGTATLARLRWSRDAVDAWLASGASATGITREAEGV